MFSAVCRKAREAVMLPLLVGAFTVGINNHKIVHILQQSAMTESMRRYEEKTEKGVDGSL